MPICDFKAFQKCIKLKHPKQLQFYKYNVTFKTHISVIQKKKPYNSNRIDIHYYLPAGSTKCLT